ncbi:MAG: sensor histidine kinase [Bacillota bacterium]|nr:sensor histidine kinase [Bacillota bacterium]
MSRLADLLTLYLLAAAAWLLLAGGLGVPVDELIPLLLIAAGLDLLPALLSDRVQLAAIAAAFVAAFFVPPFVLFLAPVVYELGRRHESFAVNLTFAALAVPALLQAGTELGLLAVLLAAGLVLLALRMERRSGALERLEREYFSHLDETREAAREQRRLQERLRAERLEDRHYARLEERNRIARELHDSIGHVLASGLLQTGAIAAVNRDPALEPLLANLDETLQRGIGQARDSIHQLRDESLDLDVELGRLVAAQTGFEVVLANHIEATPPPEIARVLYGVIREALTNVARHSDASRVDVVLERHPAFYRLRIRDNGRGTGGAPLVEGMGLETMRERVERLGGRIRFEQPPGIPGGFEIFATIPSQIKRGGKQDDSHSA